MSAVGRRGLLGGALASGLVQRARAAPVLRLGVMNDQSGPYADDTGRLGVACAQQAVDEFAGAHGLAVEVLSADHQNKADIAAGIARQWIDRDGVDALIDVGTSSCALAVNAICREKNKVLVDSSAATGELTGSQCSPNTVAWTYDTYMLAKSTGGALVAEGGDTWFFITADYVFGHELKRACAAIVERQGGRVLGEAVHPFPGVTDFSAYLLAAQASGAKVLCFANSGEDTVNCIKQAREFGLTPKMTPAAMLFHDRDVQSVGLATAQGLLLTVAYYWDLNDRTRAFNERMKKRSPDHYPNYLQAGDYGGTLHYLKAVADMGVVAAKADGRAAVARMKAIPTDDDCFGRGRIREDGRHLHPSYLMRAKSPAASKGRWDLLALAATTPADEAFRPMSEGGCPLIKA